MEPRISCSELFLRLEEDEVLIVDCRFSDESRWSNVEIPGALRMTPEEIATSWDILPDDELIVLYGASPDFSDVRLAWRYLLQSGRYAVCLDGGLDRWLGAGYPVAGITRARGERRVRYPPGTGEASADPPQSS